MKCNLPVFTRVSFTTNTNGLVFRSEICASSNFIVGTVAAEVCVRIEYKKSGQREEIVRLLLLVLCIVSYSLYIHSE
jgi:hypothetical protein